ncbi:MAG TPA: hypothetical protein VGQ83_36345 [Polyangia bacterium]|jgi:hypothetical protein
MSDLRLPVVPLPAEVVCGDGRSFTGQIYLPASAAHHAGPPRPEEWINGPAVFFPFRAEGQRTAVILNKLELVMLSVPATADLAETPEPEDQPRQRVTVECGALHVAGELVLDLPGTNARVLDCLNRPAPFVTVREGEWQR